MDIEIPRELADAEGVPEDLDANVDGPFSFPNPKRRRISGWVYFGGAVLAALGAAGAMPAGMWVVAAAFVALGAYHLATAHDVQVDESQAFAAAGRSVEFSVGHASAALRFEGFLARPVWNVLVYDAQDPPGLRALVQLDATRGTLRRDVYVEPIVDQRSDIGM